VGVAATARRGGAVVPSGTRGGAVERGVSVTGRTGKDTVPVAGSSGPEAARAGVVWRRMRARGVLVALLVVLVAAWAIVLARPTPPPARAVLPAVAPP